MDSNCCKMFDFERCPDRRGTASMKWDKWDGRTADDGSEIIPMWIADMDAVAPPAIMRCLEDRVAHGVFGYAHDTAALQRCAADWLMRRHGWDVKPEWLTFIPGVVTAMNVALRSTGSRGEARNHFCNVPAYPPFLCGPANHGHELTTLPLVVRNGRWEMDCEALGKAADDSADPSSFILCHPHNPTGRDWTVAELEAVADVCEKKNLVVISDEIWADLVLDGKHVPFAMACPKMARRTITLMAPSKTFNVPGLGCSLAIIEDDTLRANFVAAAKGIVSHVNLFGLAGAQAAWGGSCDEWLDQLLDCLRKKRQFVKDEVAKIPDLKWYWPEATFLFWIDARECLPAGVPQEKLCDWLAEKYGLGLSDGIEYGAPGWLRINYGCPKERLEEAMKRFVAAFSGVARAKTPCSGPSGTSQ